MKISSPERLLSYSGQFPGWILNEFCCSGPFLFQQIERKLAAAAGNLPPLCVFGKAAAPRCCKEPLGQIVCVPSAHRSRWVLFIYIIIPLFLLLLILFISRLYKYEMFSVDDTNRARSSPPPQ